MLEEGNIRIYITEACNAKCPNCFNRLNRTNSYMDTDVLKKICLYFEENGVVNIKIMGGEPTIHPDFSKITKIVQEHFQTVSVFTNAINDRILEFEPRENDSIIYNFKFAKFLRKEKLLLEKPGRRSMEIQITSTTNTNKLIEDILYISEFADAKSLNLCFTLDCTENIYEHRQNIVDKYEKVWDFCTEKGFLMGQDHLIPFCFLVGTRIPMPREGSLCRLSCAGLIDSSCNIKFCNQFPDSSKPLLENGEFISFEEYTEFIKRKHLEVLNLSEQKGCLGCSLFGLLCNGGCFASKETISEEDICRYRIN